MVKSARARLLALAGVVLLVFAFGYLLGKSRTITAPANDLGTTLAACVAEHAPAVQGDANQAHIHRMRAFDLCFRIFHAHYQLNDFNIRRVKFLQQQYDELVMLWMVVAITISGVILAAVQLAISYRLASKSMTDPMGHTTEITVEQNRLVFRSSVTGLAILVISFAFFLVFVLEIFAIREIDPEKVEGGSQVGTAPAAAPSQNGYGPPPVRPAG